MSAAILAGGICFLQERKEWAKLGIGKSKVLMSCDHLPLSYMGEFQKFLTWPLSQSTLSVYFVNPGIVNLDDRFPLGNKPFPLHILRVLIIHF